MTCGEGLAEHAPLPAKLAELMNALAATLEVHQTSLGPDANSIAENEGYARVARAVRDAASRLSEAASLMAASRDLPMGEHDESVLMQRQTAVFAEFVRIERETVEMLEEAVGRDEKMLSGR